MAQAGHTRLVRLLGWMSLGLGVAQITAPGTMNRLVGVRPTPGSGAVMRAVGVQEVAVGSRILARPDATGPLWARVAGDVAHLTLIARAARVDGNDTWRLETTASALAGATLVDLAGAMWLARRSRPGRDRLHARSTITINRPVTEVFRFWRDLENLPEFMHHVSSVRAIDVTRSHWAARAPGRRKIEWDAEIVDEKPDELIAWRAMKGAAVPNAGEVRFRPAPADAGTEVTVDLRYDLPGGRAGAAIATLFGAEPAQQVKDDLRRFKQVMETGEVVRSDGTPEGTLTTRQLRQHPARPGAERGP
jgi:uncharacterized membrane protein